MVLGLLVIDMVVISLVVIACVVAVFDIPAFFSLFEPSKDKGTVVKQYAYEQGIDLADSYGIGDTESDIKFLKLVAYPIAFNPNQNLLAAAREEGWRVVVEKKDVIYEISQQSIANSQRLTANKKQEKTINSQQSAANKKQKTKKK